MRTKHHTKPILLALGDAGELPREFRLFVRGVNASSKGSFLFDDTSAKAVMSAYQQWGVDIAIDLEHQMLLAPDGCSDPTARDARGWCKLAVKEDGSLWAVDVKWTLDGAERLSQKRQRYVSPAFLTDPKSKRITEILNIALVAMPATHHTPALVAASKQGNGMDPKLLAQAMEAIAKGDAKAALDVLTALIAAAAGADPEDASPPAGDGGADETTEVAAAMPPPAPAAAEDEQKTAVAATARVLRLAGKTNVVEALEEVETWRASHVALESERQALATERATLESAERRKICTELVKLGAEFPATVWADDKSTTLKPRWLSMPIVELRSHVAEQRTARAGQKPPGRAPALPSGASADGEQTFVTVHGTVTLSAREIAMCASLKAPLADYAANKAFLNKRPAAQ